MRRWFGAYTRLRLLGLGLTLSLAAVGCGDDESETGTERDPATVEDAGMIPDPPPEPPPVVPSTPGMDAGLGGGGLDAGPSIDAGTAADAGDAARPDAATPDGGADASLVRVQILGFNDFHGNIEPPTGSSGTVVTGRSADGGVAPSENAGGAAFFASHIASLRAKNPNTVVVSAGDLIGASPMVSALFHDEPTIEAMNLIGLDINGVGNHEFDDGREELLRMQKGGCHPTDGCQGKTSFEGARFQFLSANVKDETTGQTVFDRYTVREVGGVKVAFIGMTLEGTPSIVTPSGIAGLSFLDEAETVNTIVPELKAKGIHAIVVVVHEGGFQPGLYDECMGISGPIVDIAKRLDKDVDLIVSGHTHAAYNCVIEGKRVTSALSFGRIVTEVQLGIDRTSGDVVTLDAVNRIVTRDVTPAAPVKALVDDYIARVEPLRERVIGETSAALTRGGTPARDNTLTGESTLGDVIADAQRAAALDPARSLPHVAFMNPGGVRADLDQGPVTYGEAFTVQPFGNSLVTMTLTGAQLTTLLEQQFPDTATRVLLPSANIAYSFDLAAPAGSHVQDVRIEGEPLDVAASYRVTVNSFLATGGDGFTVLNDGTDRVGGELDLDALERYLTAESPLAAPAQTRITRLP